MCVTAETFCGEFVAGVSGDEEEDEECESGGKGDGLSGEREALAEGRGGEVEGHWAEGLAARGGERGVAEDSGSGRERRAREAPRLRGGHGWGCSAGLVVRLRNATGWMRTE